MYQYHYKTQNMHKYHYNNTKHVPVPL